MKSMQLDIATLLARVAMLATDWNRTVLLAAAIDNADAAEITPHWAELVVDRAFLLRLLDLHAVIREHDVHELAVVEYPTRWDLDEDQARLDDARLVVHGLGFQFRDYSKHEEAWIETGYLSTTDLIERVLADPGTSPVVSFLTVFNSTTNPEAVLERYLATTQGVP